MLRIAISTIFLFFVLSGFSQDSKNVDLLYSWTSQDTLVTGYNDIWGFEIDGEEYAVIGSNWGTHFVNVSGNQPVEVASFIGKSDDVTWRDYKTYSNYVYGVADGDTNSLQIFDIQYLPDSIVKVVDSNLYSESAHNIYIEDDRIYFCSNQYQKNKSNHTLDVFSLQNPESPELLGSFSEDFFDNNAIHDIHVRGNIAYCSASYGGLHIYDLSDLDNPVLKQKIDIYPDQGYNHSSWVSDDGTKLVMADEVPAGLALKLFDISDLDNVSFLDVFHSSDSATPHNPFFVENKIVVSYYQDGVQLFDYSDVFKVRRVGFYDTYPDNTNYSTFSDFSGCWGVYPYLLSKKILASDRKYGLFVLSTDYETLSLEEKEKVLLSVYPNPASQSDKIYVESESKIIKYYVYDNSGRLLLNQKLNKLSSKVEVNTSILEKGNYLISVFFEDGDYQNIKFSK